MCEDNQTQVIEFLLLGFQDLHNLKIPLFTLFFVIYLSILGGNLLIILLVTAFDHLSIPMFYFLKHLALADVLLTTNIVPLMLDVILREGRPVPVAGCITQLYFFGVCGFLQCFLLAVMSYDRYLAICKPMHYSLIMSPAFCLKMVSGSWLLVLTLISSETILLFQLQFCGLRNINHFFCDFGPLVELSTSDTSALVFQDFLVSIPLIFVPFVLIIITYILIFVTIMRMATITGRRKAFSTCSSHLITVCTYYVALMTVYMVPPGKDSLTINKFRSLLYIVVTPLLNPIIYSLRNQEIRSALRRYIKLSQEQKKIYFNKFN
ncbi:olfactory receptor 5G3-like [Pelodytes ibericus]